MGDRANIVMLQDHGKTEPRGTIFFYTHHYGHDLPVIMRDALIHGKPRWDDEPYLARIIFCALVRDDIDGLTGVGIYDRITDNEYPLLVIDCNSQTVSVAHPDDPIVSIRSVSFATYVDMSDNAVRIFRGSLHG